MHASTSARRVLVRAGGALRRRLALSQAPLGTAGRSMRAANASDAIGRPGPTPPHALHAGPDSGILRRWSLAAPSPASCAPMISPAGCRCLPLRVRSREKAGKNDSQFRANNSRGPRTAVRTSSWAAAPLLRVTGPLLRCRNWGRSCDASCFCIACSCSLMPRASLGARAAHRRPRGHQGSGLLDVVRTLFGAPLVSLAPSGRAAIAGVRGGLENGSLSRAMTLHQRAMR